MKKLLFLLLVSLFMVGCSNDDDQSNSLNLIGTWDWVRSSGGITGETTTPESTGTSMTLEITNTTITRIVDNDLIISENAYSIQVRETMSGEFREMLIVGDGIGQIITIEGNSLILTGDCNDCVTSEYVKQ
ncbi:hypothetical protein [uncultured Dokdonia sp.]|uniref:hypothetical protein n=1 Tax=uncultured Dokdonia sp. TaxID=575653 RepID=UPI002619CC44|nr:hypothetical protein [uncultured Dokdonia sp.]